MSDAVAHGVFLAYRDRSEDLSLFFCGENENRDAKTKSENRR